MDIRNRNFESPKKIVCFPRLMMEANEEFNQYMAFAGKFPFYCDDEGGCEGAAEGGGE